MPVVSNASRRKGNSVVAPAPYSDDVFATLLYTGTGASQTLYPGLTNFDQGGAFLSKYRSGSPGTTVGYLWDSYIRGTSSALNTTASVQAGALPLNGIASTNITLAPATQNQVNILYASWFFKMAKSFFDIASWQGGNVSYLTIPHNLQNTPGLIIVKSYLGTSPGDWAVWHRSASGDLYLDKVNQQNSTMVEIVAADQNSFTVGPTSNVNASGTQYEAFIFAHDNSPNGVIFCGGIQSDANGNATINTGWPVQFMLWKKVNGSSDWQAYDSARGFSTALPLNNANPESTTTYLTPNGTGFDVANLGANNRYVFMAIRARNKPNTSPSNLSIPGGNSIDVYAQAISVGWDQVSPLTVTITGDVGSNSTGTPALLFNGSYPDVTLVVNSGVTVAGRGGLGVRNQAGQPGGPAIKTTGAIKIINNGVIGGGGGSGGGYSYSVGTYGYSGNGAGLPILGIAGTGTTGTQATQATKTNGGNGASGYGGPGGVGGAPGSNGSSGSGSGGGGGLGGTGGSSSNSSPGYTFTDPGGSGQGGAGLTDSDPTANRATIYTGGAPGPYIIGNASVTWLTAGTRYGTAT